VGSLVIGSYFIEPARDLDLGYVFEAVQLIAAAWGPTSRVDDFDWALRLFPQDGQDFLGEEERSVLVGGPTVSAHEKESERVFVMLLGRILRWDDCVWQDPNADAWVVRAEFSAVALAAHQDGIEQMQIALFHPAATSFLDEFFLCEFILA